MLNFHHHNPKISNGIYNLSSKTDFFDGNFSAGIHPYDINSDWVGSFTAFQDIFKRSNCIAIGETGLDGRLDISTKLQTEVFLKHVDVANTLKKPVIIHCVKRFQEIIQIKKHGKTPWIIHGFNKNENLANQLISSGFYLSFGKALLHNLSLQQVFKQIPAEKIFLETDNSDIQIEDIYRKAAEIKNITLQEIDNQITQNLLTITNGAMAWAHGTTH